MKSPITKIQLPNKFQYPITKHACHCEEAFVYSSADCFARHCEGTKCPKQSQDGLATGCAISKGIASLAPSGLARNDDEFGYWNLIIDYCLVIVSCILVIFNCGTAKAGEDSPFGVCVDLDECKDKRIPALISKAGIGWVRQQIRWDIIEPKEGEFHWEGFDAAIENEYKNGLKAFGQFHWFSWSNPTTGEDEAVKNWARFVSLAVARYKDKIKYWEVWNEEDFEGFWKPTSAVNYVKLLKATYIAAKKIDPECRIILGGLMGWGGRHTYFPFLDEVYKNGGGDYFDIVAFHPYTMPQAPAKDSLLRRKIEDVLERMKNNGDANKPIWITELGWPSNKLVDPASERGVTPGQQAEYLTEALRLCLLYPQIKKVFWYGFRDVGTSPIDSEHHYGLVKNNLKAKPSYKAYKDFIVRWGKK